MDKERLSLNHLTSPVIPNLKLVTITHSGHKFYGEKVEMIRFHRSDPPTIVVRFPTGDHVAVPLEWTDYQAKAQISARATHLLHIDSLLELIEIINQTHTKNNKKSQREQQS